MTRNYVFYICILITAIKPSFKRPLSWQVNHEGPQKIKKTIFTQKTDKHVNI